MIVAEIAFGGHPSKPRNKDVKMKHTGDVCDQGGCNLDTLQPLKSDMLAHMA